VRLRSLWDRLHAKPGGAWLFSRLLGTMVPYTETIRPLVVELRPGYARVVMRDRRAVRNHLRSIHAIALMNLGEVTSGLATMVGLPNDARGILTGLSIEYLKKARGTLTAECAAPRVDTSEQREHEVEAVIRDAAGDVVARARARWLIGPIAPRAVASASSVSRAE
jgi:acyl-coenzyme A thioesterase PaaI-like protein